MKTKNNAGFTLVELAIVMMIIGLLIGGILKGQELMENARVTSTIAQIQAYEASTTSFRDIYNAFPGDMRNATARVPNCDGTTNCGNGDGNSIVGAAGGLGTAQAATTVTGTNSDEEPIQYWRHMLLADLISGVSTTTTVAWGETHPSAKIGGGFVVTHANGTAVGNVPGTPSGHLLVLQNSPTTTTGSLSGGQSPLSPVRADQIDRKMDDGMPDSGYVQGYGVSTGGRGCYETTNGVTSYQGNTIKSCNLLFRIQG
jgi:prepilin-type N-terminal cleavage/methylation domain-containing protein